MRIRASLVTFALLAAAGPVVADTVTLKNGREIHGKLVSEGKTEVRLRTAGGTITIPRADIATFNENDFIEPALDKESDPAPDATPPKPADPAAPAGGGGDAAKPEGAPAPAAGAAPTKETWVWAAGLDKATIDKMTPLRDKYLAELEKIGPTPAERLKKVELDADESAELDQLMEAFDRRQSHVRQGRPGGRRIRGNNSRNQARKAAANNVADYGALAIKPLRDKMRSANALDQRMSAQTIVKIGGDDEFKADEVEWYRYHFDVPAALITMLGAATDSLAYLVRNDANTALMGVTGQSGFGFELGKGQEVTAPEAEATKQWSTWWNTERNRWVKAEEAKEKKRAAVLAGLEEVRAGKEPATDPTANPPAESPRRR